ncbi:MAG: YifB family Mg chelatase-like AAA ATPase [Clostridia bacterium]|nr:YifB family Mg chelatase-like AAA ATPase [Clostridia bacterium]
MVVAVRSMGILGIDAFEVKVETDISGGMMAFDIVGLPDTSVKESRDRVRSAIRNCGLTFPMKRIVVNLAPADIKKAGAVYDLPILVSLLLAAGNIDNNLSDSAFIGELSLGGEVRSVNGVLPMAIQAKNEGCKYFYVPEENAAEGAVVDGIDIIPVRNVSQLLEHLRGKNLISPAKPVENVFQPQSFNVDFSDVKGQFEAKRAIEVAACGGHNILLIGSPGSGKSMLAKRIPTILPDMTFDEMIETTKIHSIAGVLPSGTSLVSQRPFRSPHHTVSPAGLSGGGSIPHPGEISLAHNGVLFLDELPEFNRNTMEILRQPIEDGQVTISRVNATLTYPCSIMLVAAMNPCPCGYYGHPTRECTCSKKAVSNYLAKVSGPLLDRLDLHVEVPPVEFDKLSSNEKAETSAEIKKCVDHVRNIQNERFKGTDITCNARITPALLQKMCPMDEKAKAILQKSFDVMGLSARAYDRILKVARTIADLDDSEVIKTPHIMEAIQYRNLDRKYWNK